MLYIENNNKLKEICKEIKNTTNIIALDTEFIRQRKYFPKLCLIQISFFNQKITKTVLIDALAKDLDLKPLISILQSKKIKKIIHCPIQDIEAFYYISKKIPRAVEDTQLMAEFCGYKHFTGYGNLVHEIFDIDVLKSKSAQKSNWKKRPLTDRQLEYASNDVKYLIKMYKYLQKKLTENKNLKFYEDENKRKYSKKLIKNIIKDSWKRLRFKLDAKDFLYVTIIKYLCRWREREAINKNRIKKDILPNSTLKQIAKKLPNSQKEIKEDFSKIKRIQKLSNQNLKEILQCVKKAKHAYHRYKKKNKGKLFHYELKETEHKKSYNKIIKYVKEKCQSTDIAPELILNKANIVGVITGFEKFKDIFYGWKDKVFGKEVKMILKDGKL